jgi:hypothetical protein
MSEPRDTTTVGAREIAERFGKMLADVDLDGLAAMMAEDGVFEYPFTVPGTPREVRGREAIRTHLTESRRQARGALAIHKIDTIVHETTDPEVAIVEIAVRGEVLATGRQFEFPSSVSVIHVRGGEIVRYKDYTNALGAAEALGVRPDQLFSTESEQSS